MARGRFSVVRGLLIVAAVSCGGPTRPTDVPETEGTDGPSTSEPDLEASVPANAPPPAAIGSDEIPDVPPAD